MDAKAPDREAVAEGLAHLIADDLHASIANLGYPVGCGQAPHPDMCLKAARTIVGRIKDQALALLAERQAATSEG